VECERCGEELAEVSSRVDDQVLTMASCSRCSARTWRLDDKVIDLTEALGLVGDASTRSKGKRQRS
jgi:hypothetical protein